MKKTFLIVLTLGVLLFGSVATFAIDTEGTDTVNVAVDYNCLLEVVNSTESLALEFENAGDTTYKETSFISNASFKLSHNSPSDKKLNISVTRNEENDSNDINIQARILGHTGNFQIVWMGNGKTRDDMWSSIPAGGYIADIKYRIAGEPVTLAATKAASGDITNNYSWDIEYTILDN